MKQKLSWLLKLSLIVTNFFFVFASPTFAHEGEEMSESVSAVPLEETVHSLSLNIVFWAAVIITLFIIATIFFQKASATVKKIFFAGIILPVVLTTFFLAGSTVYLNLVSSSGGPVHWHADLEIYNCGQRVSFAEPSGISNREGTGTFHHHGDNRIHIEGVVTNPSEVSLGRFFQVLDGSLTAEQIKIPTDSGLLTLANGDTCTDGAEGALQVFVYQTRNKVFSQQKLADPANYVISPYEVVPPADCIIIEFGPEKDRTEHICEQYKIKKEQGKIYGS